jgi:glyoxylase I family protein
MPVSGRRPRHGYTAPQTYVLEHGYRRSVYVTDPSGMIVEFTLDHPQVEQIGRLQREAAHAELKRWLAADHTSNNTYR